MLASWWRKKWALLRVRAHYKRAREKQHADNRRNLFLSLVGAGILSSVGTARADTAFTSFAFPGTGSPTSRTMPARIADIINAKEYGCVGNGVADDTTAIRAALTALWAQTNVGGTLFFPPGSYKVTETIDISNNNVSSSGTNGRIVGAARWSTKIFGNLPNGFIFYQPRAINGPEEICNLTIENDSTWIGSGALSINNTSMVVRSVHFKGMINCLISDDYFCGVFESCVGEASSDATTGYNGTFGITGYSPHVREWRSTSPFMQCLGSWGTNGTIFSGIGIENCNIGIQLGAGVGWAGSCTVSGNILTVSGSSLSAAAPQFLQGYTVLARGLNLPTWGLRWDDAAAGAVTIIDDHFSDPTLTGEGYNGTYRISQTLGSPITTPVPVVSIFPFIASGIEINAFETEGCYYSLYIFSASSAKISGLILTGSPVEGTTQFGVTGLTPHSGIYLRVGSGIEFSGVGATVNTYAGNIYIASGAVIQNVTFSNCRAVKQADNVTTSTISNGAGGAGTVLNVTATTGSFIGVGMSVTGTGVTAGTVITGNSTTDGTLTGAGGTGTYRVNNSLNLSSRTMNVITGADWVMPTQTFSKTSLRFSNCGSTLPSGVASGISTLGMTFDCLPGQAGSAESSGIPITGASYFIVDGAKSGGGTAVPGDAAQGGGTQKIPVFYDGTDWRYGGAGQFT